MNTTYTNVSEPRQDAMNRVYRVVTIHGRTIWLYIHGSGNALLLVASESIPCGMPSNLKGTDAKVRWLQDLTKDAIELLIRTRVEQLLAKATSYLRSADDVSEKAKALEQELTT